MAVGRDEKGVLLVKEQRQVEMLGDPAAGNEGGRRFYLPARTCPLRKPRA